MLLKLIGSLTVAVIAAVLTGFNLNNRCNIWIFHNFKNIPVFYAVLASFIAGVVVTILVSALNSSGSEKDSRSRSGKNKEDVSVK